MKNPRFILASRSPRRRLLLKQIGLTFVVKPSGVQERCSRSETPARNVRRIALEKAQHVASGLRNGIVIGADTIVVIRKRILGKPRNKKEAVAMLKTLSGKKHVVHTAFALVNAATGGWMVDAVRTDVYFRKLSDEEIRAYVSSGSPLDKAGAYGIQDDYGAVFVERVNGCFYNVVGFPLERFFKRLGEFLIDQGFKAK
jgi:nucleoside triphosphate pyrophosphatase